MDFVYLNMDLATTKPIPNIINHFCTFVQVNHDFFLLTVAF